MEKSNIQPWSDEERVPFHCNTCGNENPYVIGKVAGQRDCPECLELEEYMDSLIS